MAATEPNWRRRDSFRLPNGQLIGPGCVRSPGTDVSPSNWGAFVSAPRSPLRPGLASGSLRGCEGDHRQDEGDRGEQAGETMRSDSPEHVVIAEAEHPAPLIRERRLRLGVIAAVVVATQNVARRLGDIKAVFGSWGLRNARPLALHRKERPPRAPLHEQRKKATLNAAHERVLPLGASSFR